jgi:hypothetical protein
MKDELTFNGRDGTQSAKRCELMLALVIGKGELVVLPTLQNSTFISASYWAHRPIWIIGETQLQHKSIGKHCPRGEKSESKTRHRSQKLSAHKSVCHEPKESALKEDENGTLLPFARRAVQVGVS